MPPPARIGSQIKIFPITLDLGATRSLRILRIREAQENASDIRNHRRTIWTRKILSRRAFLRTSIASGASLAAVGLHAAPVGIYQPGTYSAKASGIGDVVVTITFDSNKITDVVLDVSHERPDIGQAAAKQLRQSLLKAQSADIDAVSGASITSQAVHKAASKCIAQAKGEIPVEVITKTEAADSRPAPAFATTWPP